MNHESANQPFQQQTGQIPTRVEDRHDMNPIDFMAIDDSPRPFDQLPVGENIHRSQLGNDAAAVRQCGERLAALLQSRERGEGGRRIILGDELDDSFKVESRRVRPQNLEFSHSWGLPNAL